MASDLGQTRPRWVKNAKYIRDASISPSGARVAFEYRGEIVTIPADKGDVRNLTQTAGAPRAHAHLVARWPLGRVFLGRVGRI